MTPPPEDRKPIIAATEDHPAIYRDGHRLTAHPPEDRNAAEREEVEQYIRSVCATHLWEFPGGLVAKQLRATVTHFRKLWRAQHAAQAPEAWVVAREGNLITTAFFLVRASADSWARQMNEMQIRGGGALAGAGTFTVVPLGRLPAAGTGEP